MAMNLINDLLDLAKNENMTFKLNSEKFDLLQIIDNTLNSLEFLSKSKNIKTKVEVEDTDRKYFQRISSDKNRLEQILLNLLSNAFKFTGQDGLVRVQLQVLAIQQIENSSLISAENKSSTSNNRVFSYN